MKANKKSYSKIALALSILLLLIWGIFGTGASLAWFKDATPVLRNSFIRGELDMVVSHKLPDGTYEEVKADTELFDDEALYEPGYIQVIYLKVENKGTVPFDYKLAVNVNSVTVGKGVLGNDIYLPNYLKHGVIFGADEAQLTRETAKLSSDADFPELTGDYPLNTYSGIDSVTVQPGGERYIAIIVRMPEEVGNAANYRDVQPKVVLGITVTASQEGTLN